MGKAIIPSVHKPQPGAYIRLALAKWSAAIYSSGWLARLVSEGTHSEREKPSPQRDYRGLAGTGSCNAALQGWPEPYQPQLSHPGDSTCSQQPTAGLLQPRHLDDPHGAHSKITLPALPTWLCAWYQDAPMSKRKPWIRFASKQRNAIISHSRESSRK